MYLLQTESFGYHNIYESLIYNMFDMYVKIFIFLEKQKKFIKINKIFLFFFGDDHIIILNWLKINQNLFD